MTSVTLIVSGSIAAIKAPDLVRRLRKEKIDVRCILTHSGEKFVSAKELQKLSGNPVSSELFSPKEMKEMWHIRFSRETDLIVVAPASADLIAKMAHGMADDMASATLLANNKRVLVAPAMNTQMWVHPATQRNVQQIKKDGAFIIEPATGMLACGEVGAGRMAEPETIVNTIRDLLGGEVKPLRGITALVTSGPTYEAIDPVRFIGNRSSGKQGHAIAAELSRLGAKVTLVAGPTALADPLGVNVKHVTSAEEMLKACEKSLPVDVAVCVAAVSDWRAKAPAKNKIKKGAKTAPSISLQENPDILQRLSQRKKQRPKLVIGFAAETESVLKNAAEKRKRKGCDWILANSVARGKGFDVDVNQVTLISSGKPDSWAAMSKEAVARKLAERIGLYFRKKAA